MSRITARGPGALGATESNAGDNYHVLWACRRYLRLLEPEAGLTLVSMEGVSRDDEQTTTDADAFLGVDLTEYYGGESPSEAHRVVFSRLKYSHRHPDRPWTAAHPCEAQRGKRERSVITRLARAFSDFYKGGVVIDLLFTVKSLDIIV